MKRNIKLTILPIIFILLLFTSIWSFALMQPKKGNSDNNPAIIVLSNNFYQCRYNVENDPNNGYNYDYIELKEINDVNIESALIANEYEGNIISIKNNILEAKTEEFATSL